MRITNELRKIISNTFLRTNHTGPLIRGTYSGRLTVRTFIPVTWFKLLPAFWVSFWNTPHPLPLIPASALSVIPPSLRHPDISQCSLETIRMCVRACVRVRVYDTRIHTIVWLPKCMYVTQRPICITKLIKVASILASETSGTSLNRQSTAFHPTLQYVFLIKELHWNHTTFWFGLRKLYFIKRVNFSVAFSLSARKASVGTFSFLLTGKQSTLNSLKQFTSPETNSCSGSRVVGLRN